MSKLPDNSTSKFSTVSLNEFHVFRSGETTCLLAVDTMIPYRLSESSALAIDRALLGKESMIDERTLAELRRLNLIAGENNSTSECSHPRHDSQAATKKVAAKEVVQTPAALREAAYAVTDIALFVAQACNMRCTYCFGNAGEFSERGLMTEETAYKAVDWLMEHSRTASKVSIRFFGGEPILNFRLVRKVVGFAKSRAAQFGKEISFSIATNGAILSNEILDFIRVERIIPTVSFDGPPDIQNRQRPFQNGGASYDKVSSNIRRLLKIFPDLSVKGTASHEADPSAIAAAIRGLGVRVGRVSRALPSILKGRQDPEGLAEAEERLLTAMLDYSRGLAKELLESTRDRNVVLNSLALPLAQLAFREKQHFFCSVGKQLVGISASGDIYPCEGFVGVESTKLGSLDDYVPNRRMKYLRSFVDRLPDCSACWARYFCGGGCLYEKMAYSGDMCQVNRYYCDEVKFNTELAISVYLQMDPDDIEYFTAAYLSQ